MTKKNYFCISVDIVFNIDQFLSLIDYLLLRSNIDYIRLLFSFRDDP